MVKLFLRVDVCVENLSITHRVHWFSFHFMEAYHLLTDSKEILHIPIWALLI